MALSITLEPDALNLAKNQILYRVESDNYITAAGSEASQDIIYTNAPVHGDELTLELMGFTYVFKFTNSPDPNKCSEIDTTSGNLVTIRNLMLAAFAQNYHLANYYLIGTNAIQAKYKGSEFNITASTTSAFITIPAAVPGVDTAYRPDFEIIWDLFMGSDSSAEPNQRIVTQYLQPDADQRVYPDMQELLLKQLSPDIPFYGSNSLSYNDKSLRKFMLRYAEYYEENAHCYLKATVRKVMLAGIALERWPFLNFSGIFGAGVAGQKFLTNLPREVLVDANCQNFLSLLVLADFEVFANIHWDDGTSTLAESIFSVTGQTKSMAIIPVGFNALNLIALKPVDADYALSYEIYVTQGGNDSEIFRFELDNFHKLNPRRIIFHNSLNGWDTLWSTGDQERSVNNRGDDYAIPMPRNFKPDSIELLTTRSNSVRDEPEQVRVFQLNTGYRSREYIQALARELSLSQLVLMDTGSNWREIRVDRGSIEEIDNDSDELWSLTFTYTYGYIDKSF